MYKVTKYLRSKFGPESLSMPPCASLWIRFKRPFGGEISSRSPRPANSVLLIALATNGVDFQNEHIIQWREKGKGPGVEEKAKGHKMGRIPIIPRE